MQAQKAKNSNISGVSKVSRGTRITKHKPASRELNDIKEIKKSKGFLFLKIAFVTLIVIVLIDLAANLHKINSAKAELDSLQQQHNSERIANDALQQQIDAPVDDNYIANVVKGMGYRKSDEILFYLDTDN
ncbi:MAG: hypothetical protein FWD71_10030 [Oscillospiraceae bacterium]|nr:hypothetical protein [Oscillospiraceae bacterium]